MKTYETKTPRAAFGVAAVAMTLITLCVAVVAPATLDARSEALGVLAAVNVAAPAITAAADIRSGNDMLAIRGPKRDAMQTHKDWLQGGNQG